MTEERRLEIEAEERARLEIRARLEQENGTAFNTTAAAVISIFIPGGGHAYKGQPFNGLAWFFVVVCGYAALLLPGVILHLVCIYTSTLPTRPKRAANRVEEDPALFRARMLVAAIFITLTAVALWKAAPLYEAERQRAQSPPSSLHPAQHPPPVQPPSGP